MCKAHWDLEAHDHCSNYVYDSNRCTTFTSDMIYKSPRYWIEVIAFRVLVKIFVSLNM